MAGTPRSCTACRQAKVACDARKKPINTPCTRCGKNQLECRFDKNFKRIRTRKLTANLTNELHQLRMSQDGSEASGRKPSLSEVQLREPESLSVHFPFLFTNVTESLPDFSIGDITIPSRTIVELIQHFGYQYHAHAQFIQPIDSLARFYTTSPLLFWTIILLASHFHMEHGNLYDKLLSPHEELLRPFSNTAIQSIHEIHALLLLCIWPIPRRVEASNPTWNYVGLAVGACMRLDLNKATPSDLIEPRPNTSGWVRRSDKIRKYCQTKWVHAEMVYREATFLGFLPPLSCRPYLKHSRKVADEMRDHLLSGSRPKLAIHEIICNYSLVLEEVDGSFAQLSLVETFDYSLDILKETYSAEWSTDVDVLLQYAKLNLNTMALVRMLVENEGVHSTQFTDIQTMIIRGSEASSRLIGHVKTITSEALARGDQSAHVLMPICYPRFYFAALFFAAAFIFRTSYMRPSISRDASVEYLIEVFNIYRLFPRHPDMANGADAIQHLLRHKCSESAYTSSPIGNLTTTNRLGASIAWDTLMHLTLFSGDEKFSRQEDSDQQESQESQESHNAITPSLPALQDAMLSDMPEDLGGLTVQDTLNIDWADIDLPVPTFDIFGLEAGEHIIW
ncbi:hypothetical protein GQX73_g2029 [Xylaria multiplex]|uniref:Zn(2)-C6 fungal-type domain-containing protein n=1 Tax=Xylaria multiplex TaxID=323545 RepID=A0A7C8IXH4_9PEZI|nr:hypothetical protein GQX73_g2029 [Xylaria multiplex]